MCLEDCPSQIIGLVHLGRGVAGEVAAEQAEERKAEEVGERALGLRFQDRRQYRPVAGIEALAPVRPFLIGAIAVGEGEPFQDFPMVEAHAIDHADLIAVLQVLAHSGQFDPHRNAEWLQHHARANTRQHQELRRVEGAAAQDHLARGSCLGENAGSGCRLAMGAI